jgi:hypothetical protein
MFVRCAPVVLLGTWLGLRFFDRIKDRDFNASS